MVRPRFSHHDFMLRAVLRRWPGRNPDGRKSPDTNLDTLAHTLCAHSGPRQTFSFWTCVPERQGPHTLCSTFSASRNGLSAGKTPTMAQASTSCSDLSHWKTARAGRILFSLHVASRRDRGVERFFRRSSDRWRTRRHGGDGLRPRGARHGMSSALVLPGRP